MIKKVTFILICLVFVFVISNSNKIYAESSSTVSANIKVDHLSSGLDRLGEKIGYFFKFSNQAKLDYQAWLLEKRLAEIQFAVEQNKVDNLEEVASRYSTYAGKLTDFAIANKMVSSKDKLLLLYQRQAQVVENLQRKYEFLNGWWIMLEHDINSLKIYGDQINNLK